MMRGAGLILNLGTAATGNQFFFAILPRKLFSGFFPFMKRVDGKALGVEGGGELLGAPSNQRKSVPTHR